MLTSFFQYSLIWDISNSAYCFVTVALRVFTLNVPSEVLTLYTPFLTATSLAVMPMKEKLPSSFLLML